MAPDSRLPGSSGCMGQGPLSPDPGQSRAPEKLVQLGRIVGTHGLRGALRLRLDDPDSEPITTLRRLFIERAGCASEYRVLGCSALSRSVARLVLEGIGDVNEAEALKGSVVSAAEEDLPPAAAHEFYYYQALGCEVALADGRVLGKIEEVFFNGANDVWVVRDGEREILVPVIADVVKAADFTAGRVTIEPIPGLLD